MSTLCRGRIVWAETLDPQGRNPKQSPCVVVTATEEIVPGTPLVAVAITGTAGAAPPEDEVEIPWHADRRHSRTGLTAPSVAVCSWRVALLPEAVRSFGGVVPAGPLLRILARLAALDATGPTP